MIELLNPVDLTGAKRNTRSVLMRPLTCGERGVTPSPRSFLIQFLVGNSYLLGPTGVKWYEFEIYVRLWDAAHDPPPASTLARVGLFGHRFRIIYIIRPVDFSTLLREEP